MKVLGIRNSPTAIRYVILDGDRDEFIFVNRDSESKIKFPRGMTDFVEKLVWAYREFERIIDQHGPFDSIAVKQNENVRTTYSQSKPTAFLDALIHLVAGHHHIPLVSYTYTQIATNSAEVEKTSAVRVGKTLNNWDRQVADAAAAAYRVLVIQR